PGPHWSLSAPEPPTSVSFPGPPASVSLPPSPYSLSLPALPISLSALAVPRMTSFFGVPTIVAASTEVDGSSDNPARTAPTVTPLRPTSFKAPVPRNRAERHPPSKGGRTLIRILRGLSRRRATSPRPSLWL